MKVIKREVGNINTRYSKLITPVLINFSMLIGQTVLIHIL